MGQNNNNQINQAIRYSPIIKYILQYKPKKILEIGSGSQGIGRFLDIDFDGLDLTSSDYSGEELETYKGMNFIEGSALDIPLKDNSYDFVYSCDMLEHINKKDREKAINEAIRVCKKGGLIIFCFPCGIIAKLFDYSYMQFYKLLMILYKNLTIPGRLKEHLEIEYPSEIEISKLVNNLKNKYKIDTYYANNIFWRAIIMLIDISRFTGIRNKIINKYVHRPRSGKSIFPYRKYIIIHK